MSKQRPTKSGTRPVTESGEMFGDESSNAVATAEKPHTEIVEAAALTAGIECPFTDGCRGKVVCFNRGRMKTTDADGKPATVRFQQFKCNKCNAIADGAKLSGVHVPGSQRFFNRESAQVE